MGSQRSKLDASRERAKRAPYVHPEMVKLGNVHDLTLSGGVSHPDGKASRGSKMM